MTLVLDASVVLSWAFEDEATAELDRVLDLVAAEGAIVPALWSYELGNGVLTAFRRGRMSARVRSRFLELLSQLPIDVVAGTPRPADLVQHGETHDLTAYDAAYLGLALDRSADLATIDGRLAEAARRAGLTVLPS
jgi:predicted nucleic acid-binding protein